MAEQNINIFCNLNFVKSSALFSDLRELSMRLKGVTDFYFGFLKKLEFLPYGAFTRDYFGHYDFLNINGYDRPINEVIHKFSQKKAVFNDVTPVHVRFSDIENMHLVVGLSRIENINNGFLHIVDLCLPKKEIRNISPTVNYVKEILDCYVPSDKQTLQGFIEAKGFNYSHFQRDCKMCFGDSFYSFWLKGRMMEAVKDIIFTPLSLKEIAFKNRFLDYQNMYKAFTRHGVVLKTIPRLAKL
ncbi:helix-turn-helix domain-containing protein [Sphingobacterium multivorum]|nr:AraC family transcriptional regulator [Sphingobacterium multivorum]